MEPVVTKRRKTFSNARRRNIHHGPKTEAAVKRFQQLVGIKADGIVGTKTREELALRFDGAAQTMPAMEEGNLPGQ